MKEGLRHGAEQIHGLVRRLVATRFPSPQVARKERLIWLLVAVYCEMQDVADDGLIEQTLNSSPWETDNE